MKRRVLLLSTAALLLARAAGFAQARSRPWRVGFLASIPRREEFDVLRKSMRELGHVEGKDVVYERRFTDGSNEPLAGLAAELVALPVDVLVTFGTPATQAAQNTTKTIPIVMVYTGDPLGSGLVPNLARPGGNTTGVANLNTEINAKRVDLLVLTLPNLSRVAALLNPTNATYRANVEGLEAAARKAKVKLLLFPARTLTDIERAFPAMKQQGAEALIVHTDSLFGSYARQVGEAAIRFRLPVIGHREVVRYGGLMSYEPNRPAQMARAAAYVDRILKGAKPADMPVEQPVHFDLTVNLRAARTLGIEIPREVLLLADEVIGT